MTIAPMMRATLAGRTKDRDAAIAGLQTLGCLHIVPLREPNPLAPPDADARRRATSAWRHLDSAAVRRRPWPLNRPFDAEAVVEAALANKQRLRDLRDRRDFLVARIADLEPFGDFKLPPKPPRGRRLWFYRLPLKFRKALAAIDLPWAIVGREPSALHVCVISPDEPPNDLLPVPRVHLGSRALSQLQAELEMVDIEIEQADAELSELTRHRMALGARLAAALDADDRRSVAAATLEAPRLFAVTGWVPADRTEELDAWARESGLALAITPPAPDDTPPTLLENPGPFEGAAALTTFYMTPAYRAWDPSLLVFASFAVFFAMILADAGYALVLGLIVLLLWGRMGSSTGGRRLRTILGAIVATAFVYGVLAGSYFSAAPPEGGPLDALKIIDVTDINTMMVVSVVIGVLHITLANLLAAANAGVSWAAFQKVGWAVTTIGGLVAWQGPRDAGLLVVAVGLSAVFLGGALSRHAQGPVGWLMRLAGGALSLAGISRLFGDVLSYMRLFALGLSSASLGATFNGIAASVEVGTPGLGLLFAGLILILGHAINLALGIISGVVHGLRLNVLEFFGWSLSDEGYPFKAFARRDTTQWTN